MTPHRLSYYRGRSLRICHDGALLGQVEIYKAGSSPAIDFGRTYDTTLENDEPLRICGIINEILSTVEHVTIKMREICPATFGVEFNKQPTFNNRLPVRITNTATINRTSPGQMDKASIQAKSKCPPPLKSLTVDLGLYSQLERSSLNCWPRRCPTRGQRTSHDFSTLVSDMCELALCARFVASQSVAAVVEPRICYPNLEELNLCGQIVYESVFYQVDALSGNLRAIPKMNNVAQSVALLERLISVAPAHPQFRDPLEESELYQEGSDSEYDFLDVSLLRILWHGTRDDGKMCLGYNA